MNRYSEYKDSGVEWIGEIPKHWEVKKLGFGLNVRSTRRVMENQYSDEGIPFYRSKEIVELSKNIEPTTNIFIDKAIYSRLKYSAPKKGDLLITAIGTIGQSWISDGRDFYYKDGNLIQVDNSDKIKMEYLQYLTQTSDFNKEIKILSEGSTLVALTIDKLNNMKIIYPSQTEQEQIVIYLDKKTSQIETLISKKEELIETLKASRTKLISETVTKGLDKDVPMKDSGVEWIGEIPSHYEIKKLKNLCTHIGRGKSPEYEDNTDTYTVNQACLYWNYFKEESIKSVSNKFYNSLNSNQKINKGDILINSTGGGNLGKSAFFDKTGTLGRVHFYEREEKYAYDSHVTMLRLKESFNKKYFYYMFCTKNVHSYIDLFCVNGSTKQIELSKTGLESIVIPVPIKKEQDEISKFLDEKTSQIDTLVATVEEQIELLKKAKQKLITEVVTGKIDVTNL